VVKCPPFNWKVGCSNHGHWVNRCSSAHWARAFTSTVPKKSQFRRRPAANCRRPRLNKNLTSFEFAKGASEIKLVAVHGDLWTNGPKISFILSNSKSDSAKRSLSFSVVVMLHIYACSRFNTRPLLQDLHKCVRSNVFLRYPLISQQTFLCKWHDRFIQRYNLSCY